MARERQPFRLCGLGDCKKAVPREAVVNLDEIYLPFRQRIDRASSFIRRMNYPNVILLFRRWTREHRPGKQEPQPCQISVDDATAEFREFRDISTHVANSSNPPSKQTPECALVSVGMHMHVPQARNQELPSSVEYAGLLGQRSVFARSHSRNPVTREKDRHIGFSAAVPHVNDSYVSESDLRLTVECSAESDEQEENDGRRDPWPHCAALI